MSDLRQRRHRETRRQLVDAALDLFDERGYAAVTMGDIAGAAGVSRRTLYRHFPTKDRVVLDLPVEWTEVWDETLAALPPDTSARDAVEQITRTIAGRLDEERERMQRVWRIVESTPALEPAFLANRAWTERILALLADARRGPVVAGPEALTIAGAYLGAIDVAMADWAAGADDRTVTDTVDALLAHLRPLWPADTAEA
ncbi:TetR/AcrR family transcriptional regulator [Iamia sp. SCSIO 61187]|uniref:TetR/AcrR family transcriptional regulator n=1 Tax=Iamia sp. SCSIO 61187 TaxID=2722752 RepID=UPI001C6258C4|nr:TetR/AcrR family transcriptional regulator [Iamia sp. SCSIO 61187]QYG94188.1 TetR/AcrR family transcriptional regulator [Iamia sp. SCSIO 61187]